MMPPNDSVQPRSPVAPPTSSGWRASLGLSLALAAGGACTQAAPEPAPLPDLVLVTLDTVRADHLELYGYGRATAPRIAALATDGVLFRRAISQAPWTLPSMASLHTGLYPSEHRALNNLSPIPMESPMVAELLQRNGYRTQAVVSHVFVGRKYGFGRGFDVIDENHVPGHDGVSSEALTETALALYRQPTDAPTFLWVHYFDPHYTYIRHPEYEFATGEHGRFEDYIRFETPDGEELHDVTPDELEFMRAVYDEELAHTDAFVGKLIDGVRASAGERSVIFLVTADHGETFMERGALGHGKEVYDELVHVPLVIGGDVAQELRGSVVEPAVETRSIAATLLGLARVVGASLPGDDLMRIARGAAAPEFVFSEGSYARGIDRRKLSAERERTKLILDLDDGSRELYRLSVDPREAHDKSELESPSATESALLAAIEAKRIEFARSTLATHEADLTDEERAKLEALGYFDKSDEADSESDASPGSAD